VGVDGFYTPVERHGDVWLKRDDLYSYAGRYGGKVRTCQRYGERAVATGAVGLITAGSRHSPQVSIVSAVAAHLGLACRVHVPTGATTPELDAAMSAGAEVCRHKPGYNSVIISRAQRDAAAYPDWLYVPFGMETDVAVEETSHQAEALDVPCERVVVPVGSGMSLCGVLAGLCARQVARHLAPPRVVGVVVGADPTHRLDTYAPMWRISGTELLDAGVPYARHVEASVGGVDLDPVYEAKCVPFLEAGDLLWVVGHRRT